MFTYLYTYFILLTFFVVLLVSVLEHAGTYLKVHEAIMITYLNVYIIYIYIYVLQISYIVPLWPCISSAYSLSPWLATHVRSDGWFRLPHSKMTEKWWPFFHWLNDCLKIDWMRDPRSLLNIDHITLRWCCCVRLTVGRESGHYTVGPKTVTVVNCSCNISLWRRWNKHH